MFLIVYAFTFAVAPPAREGEAGARERLGRRGDEDRSLRSARMIETLRPPYFQPPVQIGVGDIDAAMDAGAYTLSSILRHLQADA